MTLMQLVAAFDIAAMDANAAMVAATGLFLAGIVKGTTGLGYATCALPMLTLALGLKPAMGVVLIPAMATNFNVVFTAGHLGEVTRRFAQLYLAILPGIGVGILMLMWIDAAVAAAVLGMSIIAYTVFAAARPDFSVSATAERRLQAPVGFLNGVVTGLTGSQVMPLLPFVLSVGLDPGRQVQAINLAVIIASAVLAGGLVATGLLTGPLFVISVAGILPALAGVEIGNRVRARIAAETFRKLVLVVLLVSGLVMIAKGIGSTNG